MKVLITYGGSSERIDGVRYITNFSSGKTGFEIASQLGKIHDVDCIHSERAPIAANSFTFFSFDDLFHALQHKLGSTHYDYVIHCAAVSDYLVDKVLRDDNQEVTTNGDKIASEQSLNIRLKPSFKILSKIKQMSKNPNIKTIAFKLTDSLNDREIIYAVKKIVEEGADFVVHNELKQVQPDSHIGRIFNHQCEQITDFSTKSELSIKINEIIQESL